MLHKRTSPVKVRHDRLADVAARLPEDADDLGGSGGIAAGMDDDGATELGLSVGRRPQHLPLAVRDGPTAADLADHAAADVRAVCAAEDLAHDDVRQLGRKTQLVSVTKAVPCDTCADELFWKLVENSCHEIKNKNSINVRFEGEKNERDDSELLFSSQCQIFYSLFFFFKMTFAQIFVDISPNNHVFFMDYWLILLHIYFCYFSMFVHFFPH